MFPEKSRKYNFSQIYYLYKFTGSVKTNRIKQKIQPKEDMNPCDVIIRN
jgi:hypothetical protein